MGYTTSTVHGIEVPDSSEANDVPEDIGKVVTALAGGSIIRRLTSAQIAALTGPEKPAGVYFHDTTTGRLVVSDGTNVANVASPAYCIGTRSASQSISDASETTLTYDAETDPLGMLNSGTGVVTIPATGLWLLSLWAVWGASFTGFTECLVRTTAGTLLASDKKTADGWEGGYSSLTTVAYLTAGTTIDARLYQDSTSAQNATGRLVVASVGVW